MNPSGGELAGPSLAARLVAALGRQVGLVPKTYLDELRSHYDQLKGKHVDVVRERTDAVRLLSEYERGWRPGHYYSPIPDLVDIAAREEEIFRQPRDVPGIDLNETGQLSVLEELAKLQADQPFPVTKTAEFRFFFENPNYTDLDALILFAMLRRIRPRRLIEVGSGYSSCLILDTSERFLEGALECTFIEPYPELLLSLLRPGDVEKIRLISEPVQKVGANVFGELEPGDLLFIDSSHVVKTGSDVNDLFFRVLPGLKPGVFVHIHDIYYPFEYTREWLFQGRAWNEAYLLRAFLQYNSAFSIVFFNQFLATFHREAFVAALPLAAENPGSSIWLRSES